MAKPVNGERINFVENGVIISFRIELHKTLILSPLFTVMSFCHACGRQVEPQWSACPFCSSLLPSSGQEVQQPDIPHYSPQPSYQTHTQTIPQQQYQVPQNQYVSTQFTSSGGGGGVNVVVIVAVIAVVGIILVGVLYVWASSLESSSSPYTWSGEVDSRVTDVRWYDYEGDWELETHDGDVQMSQGVLQSLEDAEITSGHIEYDWPYATLEYESDSSDWSNMRVEARMQINGDVWFIQFTSVNLDGDYTSVDDGECYASVHQDSFYISSGSNSWRSEVGNTAWPSWCDSVDGY